MEAFSHTVRMATSADAAALATLAELTFRDTFASANTCENMDEHCRRNYGEAIQASEISSPHIVTLVSEREGVLMGYAQVRPTGLAPCFVSGRYPGEIQRLYVAGEYHGKGVAQALMMSGLGALREGGCDVAWLGVWEMNPRAIAFYRRLGFTVVGEHVFQLGTDRQTDLIMVLPLHASGGIA